MSVVCGGHRNEADNRSLRFSRCNYGPGSVQTQYFTMRYGVITMVTLRYVTLRFFGRNYTVNSSLGGDSDADLEAELGDACGLADDGEDDALGGEAQ